jgi:hypothetical protein
MDDAPLTLYRGANIHEHRRRIYGFSWTTDIKTARWFAEHWSQPEPTNAGVFQGVEVSAACFACRASSRRRSRHSDGTAMTVIPPAA